MTKYNVVYIDPPWPYRNKKTGGSMSSGVADQYSTLTIDELIGLRPLLDRVVAKDSVLFLWVTTPTKVDYPGKLLEAWGYKYKTTIYWRKIMSLGMGFWLRGQVEECWVAVRGKVKAFRCQRPNFIQTKVLKHSHKPPEVRALIEEATVNMPDRKMLELFATERVAGWTSLGFEIDGKDIRKALGGLQWNDITN